jgi:hypothetical protein
MVRRSSASKRNSRADLSNIEYIDRDLALARTKEALTPFLNSTYSMHQQLERLSLQGPIDPSSGFCFGLALEWLSARTQGETSSVAVSNLRKDEVVQRALSMQATYTEVHVQHRNDHHDPAIRSQAAIKQILSDRNLAYTLTAAIGTGDDVSATVRRPGDYILGLTGFGTGHAITVSVPHRGLRDQRCTVFDPNMGDFRVSGRDMAYFLDALLARYALLGTRFNGANVFRFSKE